MKTVIVGDACLPASKGCHNRQLLNARDFNAWEMISGEIELLVIA
jgi:hypothetical protein